MRGSILPLPMEKYNGNTTLPKTLKIKHFREWDFWGLFIFWLLTCGEHIASEKNSPPILSRIWCSFPPFYCSIRHEGMRAKFPILKFLKIFLKIITHPIQVCSPYFLFSK